MVVKTVHILLLIGFLCLAFAADTLTYKIEIMKDTIYIGEPIIVRCQLINESTRDIAILAYHSAALLSFDFVEFYLYDQNNDIEYKYGVNVHTSSLKSPNEFLLASKDSVYYYTILSWNSNDGFIQLKYSEVEPGFYKIRSTYLSVESNADSFYAATMPAEEKMVFEQVGTLVDKFWSWPEGGWPPMSARILETFPELIEKEKTVLIPFCHYMLWRESLINDEPNVESLAEQFFEYYPNTPLAEKFAFDMYRYYAWYKKDVNKDINKGRSIVLKALEKYPNNLEGYLYLGFKSKREKSE